MGATLELTPSQQQILSIVHNITTFGSFGALLLFFIRIWFFPSKKISFSLKLIHNLFFADLIYCISNLLSNLSKAHSSICTVEGVLRILGCWSTVVWATLIAHSAYMMTVKNNLQMDRRYPKMIILGYFIPLIVALLPLIPESSVKIGYNGAFCVPMYHNAHNTYQYMTIIVQFAMVLGWAWLGIIFTTFYYFKIFKYLRRLGFDSKTMEVRKLLIFPVLLFIAFIFVTIDDFMIFPQWHFELLVLVSISLHGLGLFNVIAYGCQTIKSSPSRNSYYDQTHDIAYESFEEESHMRRMTTLSNDSSYEVEVVTSSSSRRSDHDLRVVLNANSKV